MSKDTLILRVISLISVAALIFNLVILVSIRDAVRKSNTKLQDIEFQLENIPHGK